MNFNAVLFHQKNSKKGTLVSRAFTSVLFVSCMVFAARAEDVRVVEQAEARSYTEAVDALMRSLSPYDVVVKFEQSIDTGSIVAPVTQYKARFRRDVSGELLVFLREVKTLNVGLAMAGDLDNWKVDSSVVKIQGGKITEFRLNEKPLMHQANDFNAAILKTRVPDLPCFIHSGIVSNFTTPQVYREVLARIFSLATRFETRQVALDGEPAVDVRAIIEDDRVLETCRWVYALPTMDVLLYEVKQKTHGNDAVHRLELQKLKWAVVEPYGRVPVEANCSNRTAVEARDENGKVIWVNAERYSDVVFQWRKFADTDNLDTLHPRMSAADFERLFE